MAELKATVPAARRATDGRGAAAAGNGTQTVAELLPRVQPGLRP